MTLKKAIALKRIKEIRKIAANKPLADVADMLEKLNDKEQLVFFHLLNNKLQSQIFSFLETDYQEKLIQLFTNEDMKDVLNDLYADEIADLVEEVPHTIAKRILANTPSERVADVKKILRYKEDVVGSFMTVETISIQKNQTVGDAIAKIKNKRDNVYIDNYVFVVGAKGNYLGFVTIDDLMFAQNSKKISTLYKPSGYVLTVTPTQQAIKSFADNSMSVLPVLDSNKHFVGIITSDDMIDVLQEETDEDFQKMSGITYDDTPYSRSNTWSLFKSRILWLMLLMISSTISQIVLDAFQNFSMNTLDKNQHLVLSSAIWTTAIVAILPVISGAAGNAGAQSSTMVIRALATADITTKQYLKVLFKEFKVSFLAGTTLGIVNFLRLVIYYAIKGDLTGIHSTSYLFLSLAASLSLIVVIMLAKIVGGALPLIAKAFKKDPAVMAAPLLTTLIDTLSTAIFFGVSIGIMVSFL